MTLFKNFIQERNELNIDNEGEKNWRKKEKNGSSKKSGFEIHFGFFEEKISGELQKKFESDKFWFQKKEHLTEKMFLK